MLTMPLWNIRNKLCEAATKFSLARNVEERHEFWCRNGDQGFQNRKLQIQNFHLYWMFQMLSLERRYQRNLPISAVLWVSQ